MIEAALLALIVLVVFAVGYPLAHHVDRRSAAILALPLGLAIVTILVTALYLWDCPIRVVRWVVVGLALVGATWGALRSGMVERLRRDVLGLAGYLAVLLLLCLPAVIGGEQFSAFQGNIWDQFSYVSASVAYSKYPHHAAIDVSRPALLADPLRIAGERNLWMRPAVTLVFAPVLAARAGNLSTLAYFYVAFLISLTYLAILYLVRVTAERDRLASGGSSWAAVLIAGVFPLGFWGQYVLDVNAWSQVGSGPLLVLLLALSARVVASASDGLRASARHAAGVTVVATASVLMYPESASMHLAAAMFAVVVVWSFGRLAMGRATLLVLLLCTGILGGVVDRIGTARWFIGQLRFGTSASPEWWVYFHRFLLGRDNLVDFVLRRVLELPPGADPLDRLYELQNAGAALAPIRSAARSYLLAHPWDPGVLLRLLVAPIDVILGVCGLSFLTLASVDRRFAVIVWSALALVAIYVLARLLVASARLIAVGAGGGAALYLGAFLGFLFCAAGGLLALGQAWSAGKAVSMLAPYLTTALALPLVGPGRGGRSSRRLRPAAALYVALAIGAAFFRIAAVADAERGIHYRPPYPAVLHTKSKTAVRWAIDHHELERCSAIELDVADPFVSHYVMMQLSHAGKQYHSAFPLRSYIATGAEYGWMPPMPTNCVISARELNGDASLVIRKSANGGPAPRESAGPR